MLKHITKYKVVYAITIITFALFFLFPLYYGKQNITIFKNEIDLASKE